MNYTQSHLVACRQGLPSADLARKNTCSVDLFSASGFVLKPLHQIETIGLRLQ